MMNEENFSEAPTSKVVPVKSSKHYACAYNEFTEWRRRRHIETFGEDVLLSYFEEQAQKLASTSLWTKYSMLRSTILLNHNVNIESYSELKTLLRKKAESHVAKKSNLLTAEQIKRFLHEAPDDVHLITKVALIMGVIGALRKIEMYHMNIDDVQDLGTALLVTVPNTSKNFSIMNVYYEICKRYIDLRPRNCKTSAFFLSIHKRRGTVARFGLNKLRDMGRQIAKYLNLPDSKSYTGNCIKLSAATVMIDSEGDIKPLVRPSGWKYCKNSSGNGTNDSKNENGIERGRRDDENSQDIDSQCEYSRDSFNIPSNMANENDNLGTLLNVTPEITTISLSDGENKKAKTIEVKKKKSKRKYFQCECTKLKNEFHRKSIDVQRRQNKFLRRKLMLMEKRVETLEKLLKPFTQSH